MKTYKPAYDCNYSEFDIKEHSETYINYCEVIIDETGKIHYAHPSHQEFLIRKICKDLNISRGELYVLARNEDGIADWMDWLMEKAKCICVWYEFYTGKPNQAQLESLKQLKEYGCIDI